MGNGHSSYQAGVCNIGVRERRNRAVLAALAFIISMQLWLLLRYGFEEISRLAYLAFALPLYAGSVALVEAAFGFCVIHAASRTWRFGSERGGVTEAVAQEQDRRYAFRILAFAAVPMLAMLGIFLLR